MNLVINSQFRPFTYDEMVKPLVQYKEAYEEVEQDYFNLAAQTEIWKDLANQTNSPEAYAMYQRYSNDLSAITEDFSKGMNLNNRSALMSMKRRYAQDIVPIANAATAMKEANDLRAKASPDSIFEVNGYNSIDTFLHGKTANNRYQSREALTKKTAAMTEAAMAEALQDPEFRKAMGDQFWMITQHTGGSYEELMEAVKLGMMDNPIAHNRFSQIRQEMLRNSGIQNYDTAGQQAIIEAINTGLYAGLDKPVRNFHANADHLNPLQSEQLNKLRDSNKGPRKSASKGTDKDTGEYVANDIIYEITSDGKASVPHDMRVSDIHGYRKNWGELSLQQQEVIEKHIGQSDKSQYEYYVWIPTKTNSDGTKELLTDRTRVQIKRKQSYTKPGPTDPYIDYDPTESYLND